ncbi:MAG: acyl-CoA dehydrogenase family protein [Deltaproteobacteria bacterium]|nr:acyl-CoA dehydrogenase family protein [Deltaproteobacteria bacterium]
MKLYLDLNMSLTDEQIALREAVHKFADTALRPAARNLDLIDDPEKVIAKDSEFWAVFRTAYELGYHASGLPVEVGGMGLGPLETHLLCEEMGWGSSDFAIGIGVSGLPFAALANTGNMELIEKYVVPFVQDREARFIGCWAITEPQHGSDFLYVGTEGFAGPKVHAQVSAKLDGDNYILKGQKSAWVSNGTIATHALVFLSVDRDDGTSGGGVAFVPLDLDGITRGKPLNKMGQRALNQGEIYFDDVKLPKELMLIEPEMYEFMLDMVLAMANAGMGAIFTGVARSAFEEALAYTKVRVQGGKPICEHQLVQKHLFDMFRTVEACRALSRNALIYNQMNLPPQTQYSIASKTFCTDAAFEVSSRALGLFGGNGLSREYPIEKIFRDARASLIEDGTNDVLSLAGARLVLDRY